MNSSAGLLVDGDDHPGHREQAVRRAEQQQRPSGSTGRRTAGRARSGERDGAVSVWSAHWSSCRSARWTSRRNPNETTSVAIARTTEVAAAE